MKAKYLILIISLLSLSIMLSAQESINHCEFEIYKMSFGLYLKDTNQKKYTQIPKDKVGDPLADLVSSKIVTTNKIREIEKSIFTKEEIDRFAAKGRNYAICRTHSSGKIVAVSFELKVNKLNDIEIKKFASLKNRLIDEVSFDFQFIREVGEDGYIGQSFPIFVLQRRE